MDPTSGSLDGSGSVEQQNVAVLQINLNCVLSVFR